MKYPALFSQKDELNINLYHSLGYFNTQQIHYIFSYFSLKIDWQFMQSVCFMQLSHKETICMNYQSLS